MASAGAQGRSFGFGSSGKKAKGVGKKNWSSSKVEKHENLGEFFKSLFTDSSEESSFSVKKHSKKTKSHRRKKNKKCKRKKKKIRGKKNKSRIVKKKKKSRRTKKTKTKKVNRRNKKKKTRRTKKKKSNKKWWETKPKKKNKKSKFYEDSISMESFEQFISMFDFDSEEKPKRVSPKKNKKSKSKVYDDSLSMESFEHLTSSFDSSSEEKPGPSSENINKKESSESKLEDSLSMESFESLKSLSSSEVKPEPTNRKKPAPGEENYDYYEYDSLMPATPITYPDIDDASDSSDFNYLPSKIDYPTVEPPNDIVSPEMTLAVEIPDYTPSEMTLAVESPDYTPSKVDYPIVESPNDIEASDIQTLDVDIPDYIPTRDVDTSDDSPPDFDYLPLKSDQEPSPDTPMASTNVSLPESTESETKTPDKAADIDDSNSNSGESFEELESNPIDIEGFFNSRAGEDSEEESEPNPIDIEGYFNAREGEDSKEESEPNPIDIEGYFNSRAGDDSKEQSAPPPVIHAPMGIDDNNNPNSPQLPPKNKHEKFVPESGAYNPESPSARARESSESGDRQEPKKCPPGYHLEHEGIASTSKRQAVPVIEFSLTLDFTSLGDEDAVRCIPDNAWKTKDSAPKWKAEDLWASDDDLSDPWLATDDAGEKSSVNPWLATDSGDDGTIFGKTKSGDDNSLEWWDRGLFDDSRSSSSSSSEENLFAE